MKNAFLITLICLSLSCEEQQQAKETGNYIVETTVQLQPGKIHEVLELFKVTNPELVRKQSDWVSASFSKLEEKDIVIVRAEWKNKASYLKFAQSEKFKKAMGQFNPYFIEKPKVTITKVLFEK